MKFVHIADVHFDAPFTTLKNRNNLDNIRRLEQRKAFNKVIKYIEEEKIDYLFISGDLYENEYVKKTTIEYINNLFKTIPNTKIFISPGNHDPNIKGSFYDIFQFNENVKIFKSNNLEKIENDDMIIYGAGFTDFYMNENPLDFIKIEKSNKLQILVIHADLNGVKDKEGLSYNPILEKQVNSFDYVALGHIHKSNFDKNKKIIYPGSLISLGFDEQDNHGMVVGEINGKSIDLEYISLDNREFFEQEVFVDDMYSKEDLIEFISTLYIEKNRMCKIILKGKRKFIIDVRNLENFIDNENIIKIKDETKLGYDLEEISKEVTLRGAFVRKLLEEKKQGFYSEDEINKAIEIGLEAME